MKKYLLITGKLAKSAVDRVVASLPEEDLLALELPCTVAALMTVDYVERALSRLGPLDPERTVLLPGLCQGDIEQLSRQLGVAVERGPEDIHDLPAFFHTTAVAGLAPPPQLPVRIVAEIVEAPRLDQSQLVEKARYYWEQGADLIDLGGLVGQPFPQLKAAIHTLREEGFPLAVDSHEPADIRVAAVCGVELMLSFTSANIELARDFPGRVVVIPDPEGGLDSLLRNMEKLDKWGVDYVADPIMPPITMGFCQGVERYVRLRRDFPDLPLLMGGGNVSELLDADTPGVNALLMGIAAEQRIDYLLTCEVAHHCQGTVAELAAARRLYSAALAWGRPPKRVDDSLLMLKDRRGNPYQQLELMDMAGAITDSNYRIFVADRIYLFNAREFYAGNTAEEIFNKLPGLTVDHSFYLGRELSRAELALKLDKKYVQDQPLDWGCRAKR